jgi:hypothetical protein
MGVVQDLPFGEKSAKHILYYIFSQIVDFKRQDYGKEINHNFNSNNNMDMDMDHHDSSNNNNNDNMPSNNHIVHIGGLAPMKELNKNRANLEVDIYTLY